MKRCLLVSALCCVAAAAQSRNQNAASKLQPYQAKALENALRKPGVPAANSFSRPFVALPPVTGPKLLMPNSVSVQRQVGNACAIPLRPVPANPDADGGIQRKLDAKAFSVDRMPVARGLPVCR